MVFFKRNQTNGQYLTNKHDRGNSCRLVPSTFENLTNSSKHCQS